MADGLFTWPSDEPRLIGAQCTGCGLVAFPAGSACARCGGTGATEKLLPDRGTLWTFTTQDFRPPSPPYDGADTAETFRPYALGYVELPGEVMVEARLTEPDPARLAIGQPMRLAIVPYSVSADGTQVMTFAFAPCSPGGTMPPRPPLLTGGLPASPYPPGPPTRQA
ncbi:MAG: OB-fold domain-containing protein [Streptosporangiaceae bacterium]